MRSSLDSNLSCRLSMKQHNTVNKLRTTHIYTQCHDQKHIHKQTRTQYISLTPSCALKTETEARRHRRGAHQRVNWENAAPTVRVRCGSSASAPMAASAARIPASSPSPSPSFSTTPATRRCHTDEHTITVSTWGLVPSRGPTYISETQRLPTKHKPQANTQARGQATAADLACEAAV